MQAPTHGAAPPSPPARCCLRPRCAVPPRRPRSPQGRRLRRRCRRAAARAVAPEQRGRHNSRRPRRRHRATRLPPPSGSRRPAPAAPPRNPARAWAAGMPHRVAPMPSSLQRARTLSDAQRPHLLQQQVAIPPHLAAARRRHPRWLRLHGCPVRACSTGLGRAPPLLLLLLLPRRPAAAWPSPPRRCCRPLPPLLPRPALRVRGTGEPRRVVWAHAGPHRVIVATAAISLPQHSSDRPSQIARSPLEMLRPRRPPTPFRATALGPLV